jgi:hypothetical protein
MFILSDTLVMLASEWFYISTGGSHSQFQSAENIYRITHKDALMNMFNNNRDIEDLILNKLYLIMLLLQWKFLNKNAYCLTI